MHNGGSMRIGRMTKGVVIWSDAAGIRVRTENGGILETKNQTGIPIGTPVLLGYDHDCDVIKHVWVRDEDKIQEYPEFLDELEEVDI